MGKKQVIMSLNSPSSDEANKKVFLIMQVDEEEFENKISMIKSGDHKDGATTVMTEFNVYKARKSTTKKKKAGYEYEPCTDHELLNHFGTTSGDDIVEFYYENIMKSQV